MENEEGKKMKEMGEREGGREKGREEGVEGRKKKGGGKDERKGEEIEGIIK